VIRKCRSGVACYTLRTNTKIFCSSCIRVQNCCSWTIFCQKFCSVNYNKIFFVFVLHCKKMFIFSIRGSKKFLCSCWFAKPKIFVFVFVFSKKCAQTKKSSSSWFSVNKKSSQKKAEIFLFRIFLYRQNYEEKNVINDWNNTNLSG